MIRAEFIRPLAGKQIVLTGTFRVLSQQDARSLAVCSGATCQDTIDDSTDFLVIGKHDRRQRQSLARRRTRHRIGSRFPDESGNPVTRGWPSHPGRQ